MSGPVLVGRDAALAYAAPGWLPGGHLQTIWPALFARHVRGAPVAFTRERRATPDGDFIDIDWLDGSDALAAAGAPLLVVFHGLEGSSRSHYAQAFAAFAREHGMACAVPHFRGCSGEINLAPRAYHSGDYADVGWMLDGIAARHRAAGGGDVVAAGVSLGGNALLRWAEEAGESAAKTVRAVAAVCSPLDLAAGGAHIGRGLNRQIYTRMFLRTMKPKALAKLAQHPGLFDRARLLAARDLYEFDDVFTGPLHGFAGVDDYWRRASAKPHLARIRIPALAVNALNDPFVPATSLPRSGEVGDHVTLWQPAHGGHVGFASGAWPGHVAGMPATVGGWLLQHVSPVTPRAIVTPEGAGGPQSAHG